MAISISLVNTGSERVNMSVAIAGNTKDGNQIMVSRKGIETLRQVTEMGEKFGAPAEKIEETLTSRLKGFPNGEDVLAYITAHNVTVFEYVTNAVTTLFAAKIKEPVDRAKKGDGFKTKRAKFLLTSAAKLACRFAEASEDGKITSDMLTAGFNTALETLKSIDIKLVLFAATKIATDRGVDSNGFVRLRGEASETE